MKSLLLLLFLFALAACSTTAPSATLPPNVQANVDALNASGQVDAAETLVARSQSTVTVATALAQSTRDADNRTATRDALELQYAHITQTAVAKADGATVIAKTETANGQATVEQRAAIAKTESAIAQMATTTRLAENKTEAANTHATIIALANVAKTESAEHTATAQARADASATDVAMAPTRVAIARIQADEQAARDQAQAEAKARAEMSVQLAPYRAAWDMFAFPTFLSLLAMALIAGMFLLLRSGAKYLDAHTLERTNAALTRRVITDRNGAPIGFITEATDGTWMIEAMPAQPLLPAPAQPETPSETPPAPPSEPDADDLLRVNNPLRGDTFISRGTPEENDATVRKMLALRLLRDAMQYYARRNLDVRVAKIPSYRDLEWSSETWVRAVDSLKPFVITKSGRGGGTFCAPEYPHLVALYDAVENNKVVPCPSVAPPLPSPALSALAA